MGWHISQVRSQLFKQTPEEFEELVALLWEKQGWKTKLTRGSNDAGVDVIAERTGIHSEKAAIQAKRYAPSNKIGRPDIQQYDTLRRQDSDVDFVIIVTTSDFTSQATKLAEQLNVKLVSGDELVEVMVDVFSSEDLSRFFGEESPNSQGENTHQTESEDKTKEGHNDQRQSDPEHLTVSQLVNSLSRTLSDDDLSDKETQLARLYNHYWEQRNKEFNGNAGSALVFNFDQAEYVEIYQMLVGLHSIEFTDRERGEEAYKTAKKYGWKIDNWEPDTSANYHGRRRDDRDANALLNLKPNGEIGESLDPRFEARFTRLVLEGFLDTTLDDVDSINQNPFDGRTEERVHFLSDYE